MACQSTAAIFCRDAGWSRLPVIINGINYHSNCSGHCYNGQRQSPDLVEIKRSINQNVHIRKRARKEKAFHRNLTSTVDDREAATSPQRHGRPVP